RDLGCRPADSGPRARAGEAANDYRQSAADRQFGDEPAGAAAGTRHANGIDEPRAGNATADSEWAAYPNSAFADRAIHSESEPGAAATEPAWSGESAGDEPQPGIGHCAQPDC